MNLASRKVVKNLLKKYQARPSKKLGQNFLVDKNVLRKFINACNLKPKDHVLEIGPGIGTLTQEIAKKAKQVIAVEKDSKMCEILKELLDCWKVGNVKVVNKDILKLDPKRYIPSAKPYKVVGNLPFYITAPVIRKFLESEEQPKEMILGIQKEVAQKICACPRRYAKRCGRAKSPQMSILAVSVQFYAKPEIIAFVSKKSFWPSPKVDAAIIKITPQKLSMRPGLADVFFRVVKAGFSHPRKQLVNNLSKELNPPAGGDKEKVKNWLLKNKVQPSQRAETLTVKDWLNLTKSFKIR